MIKFLSALEKEYLLIGNSSAYYFYLSYAALFAISKVPPVLLAPMVQVTH
jgi:hypothetical protein